ncbi:MAG: HAD family hydrolase [Capsulimonas sp.]|uniref:HAD family hydrolase n=1 Tax=Capsulimonas sp. TaxID=2494211 RepID=UPI00326540A0
MSVNKLSSEQSVNKFQNQYGCNRKEAVGLDLCYQKVKEFQVRFGNPISDIPSVMSEERRRIRTIYLLEEVLEFVNAEQVHEQADALIDLIYFAIGGMVEMGIAPQRIFEIVHKANMDKLGNNGIIYRDPVIDKIEKPHEWNDPWEELLHEVERQSVHGPG